MKINVETKFNVGDFVSAKADSGFRKTKMQVVTLAANSLCEINYICTWMQNGVGHRMPFEEYTLMAWEDKKSD